jgi:hypothetical protein
MHISELNEFMDYINVIVLPSKIKRGIRVRRK